MNKRSFAQQILNELSKERLNIDFRIDEREVFLRMDAIVNEMGRVSYLQNWKLSSAYLDEQFVTTWDGDNALTVVDVEDQPSYFTLPASYSDLPRNSGIQEIWPLEYSEFNQSVVIMSHGDLRMFQNTKAANMQGRLFGYPKGELFVFGETEVAAKFGEKFGVRLAIRDSSMISLTAPYPVPADKHQELITRCVDWFRKRLMVGSDDIRDGKTVNNA